MKTQLGVDYSSAARPKPPDFSKMKKVGVEFVFLRGTYGVSKDNIFQRDWAKLQAAGLVRGAYMFPVMHKTREPEAQVMAFVRAVKSAGGMTPGKDLPPVLDVEFPKGIKATGMSRLECLDWVHRAATALEDAFGVQPMLYTSARVWDGRDDDGLDASRVPVPALDDCPLWTARYPYRMRIDAHYKPQERDGLICPPVPKQLGDATDVWIHQYQGDALNFPGYSSNIDLNRFFLVDRGTAVRGERVKWIQRKLKIADDGVWGPITDRALREFQSLRKLPGTGVIDVRTFCALAWA